MEALKTRVVEALNSAKLEGNPDARERYLCEVHEIIFHQDKTQQLLSEFVESVVEFQTDTGLAVRKFVVTFIEEACKKDVRLLPSLFVHLVRITQDKSSKVQAKAFNAINNLFRRAIWVVITEAEDIDQDISGPTIQTPTTTRDLHGAIQSVSDLAEQALHAEGLDSGHDLVRAQAAKLIGTLALCYLAPNESARDRERRTQKGKVKSLAQRAIDANPDAISSLDYPSGHPLLGAASLHPKGVELSNTLARCVEERIHEPKVSMIVLNVIAVLIQHRPPVRTTLLEKLATLPLESSSKALKQAVKTYMLKFIKLPYMIQLRPIMVQLLNMVGAEKQARAILEKGKGKGKRAAATDAPDGSSSSKRMKPSINLSKDMIDDMDVDEAIEWVVANISFLPLARPSAPHREQGTEERKGSVDLLLQLLSSAQTKRVASEALASPQMVKKVHEFSFQKSASELQTPTQQIENAFKRIIQSTYFSAASRGLSRQHGNEELRVLDVVSRLACNSVDGKLRNTLMQHLSKSLDSNIDVLLTLMFEEYANELLFAAPPVVEETTNIKVEKTLDDTKQDTKDIQSDEKSDETSNPVCAESTTQLQELNKSRYDKFAFKVMQMVYESPTAQPYTLKLLRFAPRVTPNMFRLVLGMFVPLKPKQVSFALKCLNLVYFTRPVLSDVCIDAALYLCFSSDPSIKGQANDTVSEWFTSTTLSEQHRKRIMATAMMGLEAAKHSMMPTFAQLSSLHEYAEGFLDRGLVPRPEDVKAEEVKDVKMEVEEDGETAKPEDGEDTSGTQEGEHNAEVEKLEEEEEAKKGALNKPSPSTLGTSLYFSLTIAKPTLLTQLVKLFAEAKMLNNKTLCAYLIERIVIVDKVVASTSLSPASVLGLCNDYPKGSEDFIIACVARLSQLVRKSHVETADTQLSLFNAMLELKCIEDESRLVDTHPRVLVPVAGAIPQSALLGGEQGGHLAALACLDEEEMVTAMRNVLGSSERQLDPTDLMYHVSVLPSDVCSSKVLVGVIKVLFGETAYYTAEVVAIVMQRLVALAHVPVILFRIIAQSVLMFPQVKPFVVSDILPRLLVRPPDSEQDLWASLLGTMRFVGPMSLKAFVDHPVEKLKLVMEKYPDWSGELQSLSEDQSVRMSAEIREYVSSITAAATSAGGNEPVAAKSEA